MEHGGEAEVFSFLGDEERQRLVAVTTKVALGQGQFLFEVDDPADAVFFLTQGRLSALKRTGFHHKMQVVAIFEPGTVVGESGLLSGHVRGTSIRAIECSHLLCLRRQALEDLERADMKLVVLLLKQLLLISGLRLEKASERLAHVL
jgi:CRP-like cAMP-binding protein